jgi:hypothetical protein
MKLVNETGQQVAYWIQVGSASECGQIDVNGYVDLPKYDNQTDVYVGFNTPGKDDPFRIICDNTGTGQQVEMALIVEGGG